jgi:exosortase
MSQTLSVPLSSPAARPSRRTAPFPLPLAAVTIVMVLAHVPLLLGHMHTLNLKPHYEFYPLVFVGAGFLAWQGFRRAGFLRGPQPNAPIWQAFLQGAGELADFLVFQGARSRVPPGERRTGLFLLAVNWVLLTIAVVFDSPWLGMISFWELLAAITYLAGGWSALRAAVPALIFLLLLVPPPMNLDGKLVVALQGTTSKISNRLLDRLGVLHYLNGNTFEIGSRQYLVEEACSGINSLFSTIAVTLFCILYLGTFTRTFLLRSIVLLFIAVPFWVLVGNVIRVTSIVWLDQRYGIDLSREQWAWAKGKTFLGIDLGEHLYGPHKLFGFALFGLILAMMYSTNQFLMFLGTTVRWGKAAAPQADLPAPAVDEPRPRLGWAAVAPALCLYGLLFAFQAGEDLLGAARAGDVAETNLVEEYNAWAVDDLPEQIGSWKRATKNPLETRTRDNPFGAHSHTWTYYGPGGLKAILSFDYPFPEWHDLRVCYRGIGWRVTDTTTYPSPMVPGELETMKYELGKPFDHRGYGWFTEFDQAGRPVPISGVVTFGAVGDRVHDRLLGIKERWLSLIGKGNPHPRYFEVLQVQALIEHYGDPLPKQNLEQTEMFFNQAAEMIRAKCAATASRRVAQ